MVDAIVSFAVQRLGAFLIQEVVFFHGVKDEVVSLQRELNWMRSFLEDAEQKQDGDPRIRVWVSEIQDIAYDTEDVIETFIFKAKGPIQTSRREMLSNSVRNCFCICTIADRYDIGKEIKALKNRVLEVSRKRESYGINTIGSGVQEGCSSSASNLRDLRLTTSYAADEEDVVGFEDDAQFLQEKLRLKGVISILGMGGLGKTTLARKLYNNNCTKFDLHAWVCVSEEWNTRDLFERLIKSFKKLTNDELERLERMKDYDMREYLRNLLEGRKYLVVIDDMWQKEAWQSLRRALPDNQNRSRIIITTRKESVAELSDETHKLRFLREDESWQLFCKRAFPDSGACPPNMEKLGKEMVAKSSGLPLAIIVLGGLLSRKQFHEWHVVKERIWRELKNYSSNISLLLTLSYIDLSHELKSCFLYLGLFPEDSVIDVEKLTRMWVAEQFITQEGGEGLDDLEEVAENYLKELIRRSLIQVVARNWSMVTRCRVHDLLRDLAVNKAKELNFLHIYDETLNSAPSNVAYRRIGFHSGFESFTSFAHLHQRVRTLSYDGFGSKDQMVMNLVSKFGLLRVLNLSGVSVTRGEAKLKFDEAVGKLIHLRYLGLNKTGIVMLPESIGNCQALRTLNFDTDMDVMLPTSIKKLKQLRHLSGWFDGTPLLFEELTNLQCLNRVDIRDWLQQQKGNEFALNAFGKLLNLKVLSVVFGNDSHLVSVEPLLNCRDLIELRIKGGIKKLPEEMHKFLPNLKYLHLSESRLEQDPMPVLEMLPNLLVLILDSVLIGEKIMISTATGFPQLEFLLLCTVSSTQLRIEEGGMPMLRSLETSTALRLTLPKRLRSLPGRDSLNWDWDWDVDLLGTMFENMLENSREIEVFPW